MDLPTTRPLRRKEAALYLKERHGIPRSAAYLAKLASVGGGPRFRKAGNIPLYFTEFLDQYAEEIMSPPIRSSSELKRTIK